MGFETIVPGGISVTSAPPKPEPSAAASIGTITQEEALKGAEHAKMTTFSVSDLSKGPGGPQPIGGPSGSSVQLGGLVSGKVVVDLMDSLLPALLVLIFYKMGVETRKSQYQLTQGEKNTLAPIVEACMNSINLNFDSPWTTLVVSLLVIYGGKAAEIGGTAFLDKKTAEKTPAKPAPKPAKVVPLSDPPKPQHTPAASTNTDDFKSVEEVIASDGPPTWTEADINAVVKKRKCSKSKAVEWLNYNWKKKGGVR